ncbi:ATP-binding cassette domain-containing protein [Citroniella saccharovorans]|uniref:ATP-binding cassette domain-containing protein n=1 Tax=Citroniella saccharovorans TaxID=2053367 RepID=A0AAW9MY91_9FIRM|nr:ATP-binding cassette domain-containing protein [Citroniella saccharovorans]MEB3429380.1 ATP-binding cassette domain-containing protein [Citroniella saccharovorans]
MELEIKKLSKSFKENLVLDNLSAKFNSGEISVIMGENGEGKSTLVKVLEGELKADYIDVVFNGQEKKISKDYYKENSIGLCQQEISLSENLSILENIIISKDKKWINFLKEKEKVLKILKDLNLSLDLNKKTHNLTLKEKALLIIVKMIYQEKKILLFDESFSLFTKAERKYILSALEKLKKDKIIIIISHRLYELENIWDRVFILSKGKLREKELQKENGYYKDLEFTEKTNYMKLDSIPMDQGVFVFRADSKELEEEFVKRLIRKFKDISIISEDRNDLLAKERSLSVNLLPKGIFNIKDKERLDKVSKILKDSNIKGKREDALHTLSGGNMQKLLIKRALSFGEILLAVDPLRGLDEKSEKIFLEKIMKSNHRLKFIKIDENYLEAYKYRRIKIDKEGQIYEIF